jgi:hypothetical protein
MIRENHQHDDSWTACPPGALRRVMGEVRQTQRRAALRRVSSVLAVVCLLGASAWLGAQAFVASRDAPDHLQQHAALRCSDVRQLLVDYGHGALADTLREHIAAHLRECPHCRAQLRRLQEEEAKKQTSWLAKKAPAKT